MLELLSAGRTMALTGIASSLHMNESTAHHILATLKRRGYVDQEQERGEYRLGHGLIGLVNRYLSEMDLYSAGISAVRALRDGTGETAYLDVLQGDRLLGLIEMVGIKTIQCRRTLQEGETSLHSTASGKAMLAYLDPERTGLLLEALPLRQFTTNTLTSLDALRADLDMTRQRGYALDREENIDGIMCVAAPVFDSRGACVAATSVAFLRTGLERINELVAPVRSAATAISTALGSRP